MGTADGFRRSLNESSKVIDEAYPHVLKSQLESRLNQLEAGRQAMLHERSD